MNQNNSKGKNKKRQGETGDASAAGKELLPGRYQCQCHGMQHNVINNCTNCGRIVCEQEGEGPCQTCDKPIARKGQGRGINATASTFDEEFPDFDQDRAKAEQHKDKMLEYDKSNFMQKQVFDEQTDWYTISEDVWQGQETREQAVGKLVERNEKIDELASTFRIQFVGGQMQQIKEEFDEAQFKESAKKFLEKLVDKDGQRQQQQTRIASHLGENERKVYEDIKKEL